jgi:hypothetical protein
MSIICRLHWLSPRNFSLEKESQEKPPNGLKTLEKTTFNIDHATHSELILRRSRNENKTRLAADSLTV